MMLTIEYDPDIYSHKVLEQAIAAYQELARIELIEQKGIYYCKIINTVYDLEETCNEFDNFVLQLAITTHGDNHGIY